MYKHTPLEERLYLRGHIWHFWGYDHTGKQYTASTRKTDRKAALATAQTTERDRSVPPADPAADARKAKAHGYTLHQALKLIDAHDVRVNAAPNTVAYHQDRGRHLIRLLGPSRLCETFEDIEVLMTYSDKRLAEGATRHTIQHEHRVLRQALRMAKRLGYFLGDPSALKIEGFDQAVGMRGYYDPGENWLEKSEWVDALVDATSSILERHRIDRRDDILVYVNLGLRRREILMIKPEHVDLDKRELTIRMPRRERSKQPVVRKTGLKTDKSKRVLPLNDLMTELFRRRLQHVKPGEPLFVEWGSGNRDLQANWRRARAWLLECARKQGGERAHAELDTRLPHSLNFNDLRRTFCSLMKNAGVSLEDCAELLGHEDIAMVKLVYGHTAMETLHRAVAKLPELRLPAEEPARLKGPSRRQRRRLKGLSDRMPISQEEVVGSEGTARVLAIDPMRESGSEGAG